MPGSVWRTCTGDLQSDRKSLAFSEPWGQRDSIHSTPFRSNLPWGHGLGPKTRRFASTSEVQVIEDAFRGERQEKPSDHPEPVVG